VELESIAVHEEFPKEKAAVKNVRALKKLYGNRHLAVGRCRQLKKRVQGDGGSRKKLAAARRGMKRRAMVVRDLLGTTGAPKRRSHDRRRMQQRNKRPRRKRAATFRKP
jgi:hypothetical protein